MAKQVPGDGGKGRDVPNPFGDKFSGTTPSTPSTPSTPRGRVGSGYKDAGKTPGKAGTSTPSTQQAQGITTNPAIAEAIEAARDADESRLLLYDPTRTTNKYRPRTTSAGYDRANKVLFVRFRDGAGYAYHDVSRTQWDEFRTASSPGKYINAELNHHPYHPTDW